MAPSPEYDMEPKAPDKSATNISSDDSKLFHNSLNDQHNNSDHKATNSAMNSEVETKKVETLDDDRLRALLNEALTYKCPKDREGKSSLFKELLEEVEQDDQEACEAAARSVTGCRGSRRGARGRRALPHSNSLQDLVAAMAAETAPRRHPARHHAPAPAPASVSARALHGGSLPCGVDTSSLLSEEGGGRAVGGGYLATVRCVNPPPLAERRVSAGDDAAPADLDPLHRRSKPMFPMTYTARATLEIGSGSVCSGRAVTTTTASNQVDSAIPFSCISSPEVAAACTTTPSAAHALALDPKPLQLDSQYRAVASLTGAPPPAAAPFALRPRPDDEQPRSVIASSFNGLPLTRPNYGATSTTSTDDYKKSLDENGNSVQSYSSSLSGSSQHKKPRRKKSSKNETVIDCRQLDGYQGHKDVNELLRFIENDAAQRAPKLRAKHRDDDAKRRAHDRRKGKDKRAASLEELSRTTLEELTAAPPRAPAAAPPPDPPPAEHADFQTVTKRRRPRRRTDDPPPPEPDAAPAAPAPPAPPPASYADIARTRHNIPDLIESCNYYAEGEAGPGAGAPPPPDADPYPALEPRAAEPRRVPPHKAAETGAGSRRDRKERAAAAPDVLADRRPAVILLDCAARPRDMDGVTFGFDINEQLVRCDLLQHAEAAVPVRAAKRALRWLPPPRAPPRHHHHLHQIVDYVGHAWEDALRCAAGKARYYTE